MKNYTENLFSDERHNFTLENTKENAGPEITKEEILHALMALKNGKAAGPDQIPSEILKLIKEEQIHILLYLFNGIYLGGSIPDEWLISTIVTFSKKTNAKQCTDYR